MKANELSRSAESDTQPPSNLTATARALWLAKKGRWLEAHDLSQDLPDPDGAWIHAWLHRQEGDYGNACYWYSRARKPAPPPDAPLEPEWQQIAQALL